MSKKILLCVERKLNFYEKKYFSHPFKQVLGTLSCLDVPNKKNHATLGYTVGILILDGTQIGKTSLVFEYLVLKQ